MITNHCFKCFITLLLNPCLISGLFLHPAIIPSSHAASNITSDGTLGTAINPAGNLYNIDGGTIKGTNQFHSFSLFSVGTGDTASFNGPSGIVNIIGRVTGGQQSVIDGLLKSTIFGANLYLLNPYGVMFGRNAALDVSGSFHVSTADYLRMTDGARFYADLGRQSTLSTAPVAAFGFLSNKPAAISIQESDLEVLEGMTLSIIGGDINITGSKIVAPSGRINIASVASPGEVIPIESRDAPDLQMSSFNSLGNINLLEGTFLNACNFGGNGTVVIRGRKLLVKNSTIEASTMGNIDGAKVAIDIDIKENLDVNGGMILAATDGNGQCGDVVIRCGSLEMKNFGIWSLNTPSSSGNGGNVNVEVNTGNLDMKEGSYIASTTRTSGNAGNVNVEVNTGSLDMREGSYILSTTHSSGNGGNVNVEVNTGNLDMREGSYIMSDTFSSGNAGNVKMTADSILMTGTYDSYGKNTFVFAGTEEGSSGRGGDLSIKTGSLKVRDGAVILVGTSGSGAGGNIDINAENILVSGENALGIMAFISNYTDGSGNAGDISIDTGNLELRNKGFINLSGSALGRAADLEVNADGRILITGEAGIGSTGEGDTGNIRLKASSFEMTDGAILGSVAKHQWAAGEIDVNANSILLSDAVISSSSTSPYETGTGGTIRINAKNLLIHGAIIMAATTGAADGGAIEVNAKSVLISGTKDGVSSGLHTESTFGSGTGGNIQLSGNQIQLFNDASISSQSGGTGNAGNININAGSTLLMENSSITTEATRADGGNIHVHAGYMVNLIDSKITASVGGGHQTTGGNITIDPQYVILNDSKIVANAYAGKGGNIKIKSDVFLASPESVVDASSALGIDGTVDIQAPIMSISGTLAPMQGDFLNAEELFRDRCTAKIRSEKYSSFVLSGRDGLPIRPGSVLPSPIY
jgi:filamentous hemagglutinin family protein